MKYLYMPTPEDKKGMSRMEVWIVYWAGCCTKRELRRLAKFFQEFSK